MRISDWSSDVCSSDLAASGADKPSAAHDRSGEHRTTAGSACACELRRARCRDFRSERNQSMTRLLFVSASALRSEEHTSELQSLMRISYAVFCLKKKKTTNITHNSQSTCYSDQHSC